MAKPVIAAVDQDPGVVRALERELGCRYARDYRLSISSSGAEAVEALERLAQEGADVAVVLWGDCGYALEETDVLEHVRALHPSARRALLVPWRAWADPHLSGVIQRTMARGRIDYYVLRPIQHPDELFHERMSNFLYEWTKARNLGSYAVRVVSPSQSRRGHEIRDFLQRNGVPNAFHPEGSSEGRALCEQTPGCTLPLVVFPDGRALSNPDNLEVAEATGIGVEPQGDEFDVVVVGGGPAGLSAAVYGASEGLSTLVVETHAVGGQAGSSSLIRNFLGFPRGITGADLAGQAYQQAWIFGAQFLLGCATGLEQAGDRTVVCLSNGRRIGARAVILATGAAYRTLDAPGVERLRGSGVFYGGAAAEARLMAGEDVYVVGGANSAGQAALDLARHARQVTLLLRGDSLRAGMSEYLVGAIDATENVRVRTATTVVAAEGDDRLERLVLRDSGLGRDEVADARGLFVLIGARPHTDWLPDSIARDDRGFALTGGDVPPERWPLERRPLLLETSMPNVLAIGDARHGSVKRVASAVGEGSIAVQLVHGLVVAESAASYR